MNEIRLIVGDQSGDGHDKREYVTIRSSLTLGELKKAYKAGSEKIGAKLITKVCREYEDNKMSSELYLKIIAGLKEIGRFDPNEWYVAPGNEEVWIDPDQWHYYVMAVCTIGNPELQWAEVEATDWPIGGYGLFY